MKGRFAALFLTFCCAMPLHYTRFQLIENTLAVLVLSLIWTVPNHQLPWNAFHHEVAMAVALGLMAIVVAWQTRWRVPLSAFVGVLGLLILVPWGQWLGGLMPKAGTAAVSSAYVAAVLVAFLSVMLRGRTGTTGCWTLFSRPWPWAQR